MKIELSVMTDSSTSGIKNQWPETGKADLITEIHSSTSENEDTCRLVSSVAEK